MDRVLMNLYFDKNLAYEYRNNSQKIRIMSEIWASKNIYCPCCGNPHITKLENNIPVADFQCDCCGEIFELKSKCGNIGKKINDGAYGTMIKRITSIDNPDLFVLSYTKELEVTSLFVVPKFFFVPSIIEKRKPLSITAHRAGWVGCNILISKIPLQGKISIISNKTFVDAKNVIETYNIIKRLQTNNLEDRGWLFDVLNCINEIPSNEFTLKDVYQYSEILQIKHIKNHNVEAKIRQQLQLLRDKGYIEFVDRGKYRKIIS